MKERGQLGQAISLYQRALELKPDDRIAHQNLLYLSLCSSEFSEEEIFGWHRKFGTRFEANHDREVVHANSREPDRPLRIGYISPDFREHVAGRCFAPIATHHDRQRFSIFCYYNGQAVDDITQMVRSASDGWRQVAHLDDDALCERIRNDGIDILVDLSGHTPGNRLLAFAKKPAPVQVTYLDYSGTTGMTAMDYRLTDAQCDPAGIADAYYTERLVRLPDTYWLYNPPTSVDIAGASEVHNGAIRLGCVNAFYRIGDAAIEVWASALRQLPDATLALVGVADGDAKARVRQRFQARGVDPERLALFGYLQYTDYINLIQSLDVALAPFPYNGAISLLDCLWHGVPVVALEGGKTFRSRMGASILRSVNLEDLLAANHDDYVKKVVALADDRDKRRVLRSMLRDMVKGSPLCNAAKFTSGLEHVYRTMWRHYCLHTAVQDVTVERCEAP